MDTLVEINQKGFADEYIDPTLDLFDEIEKLKKKKMLLFWLIITRNPIFRMLPIILATVWDYRSRQQKPMPILSFLPECISWPKQLKFYPQPKKYCCPM